MSSQTKYIIVHAKKALHDMKPCFYTFASGTTLNKLYKANCTRHRYQKGSMQEKIKKETRSSTDISCQFEILTF